MARARVLAFIEISDEGVIPTEEEKQSFKTLCAEMMDRRLTQCKDEIVRVMRAGGMAEDRLQLFLRRCREEHTTQYIDHVIDLFDIVMSYGETRHFHAPVELLGWTTRRLMYFINHSRPGGSYRNALSRLLIQSFNRMNEIPATSFLIRRRRANNDARFAQNQRNRLGRVGANQGGGPIRGRNRPEAPVNQVVARDPLGRAVLRIEHNRIFDPQRPEWGILIDFEHLLHGPRLNHDDPAPFQVRPLGPNLEMPNRPVIPLNDFHQAVVLANMLNRLPPQNAVQPGAAPVGAGFAQDQNVDFGQMVDVQNGIGQHPFIGHQNMFAANPVPGVQNIPEHAQLPVLAGNGDVRAFPFAAQNVEEDEDDDDEDDLAANQNQHPPLREVLINLMRDGRAPIQGPDQMPLGAQDFGFVDGQRNPQQHANHFAPPPVPGPNQFFQDPLVVPENILGMVLPGHVVPPLGDMENEGQRNQFIYEWNRIMALPQDLRPGFPNFLLNFDRNHVMHCRNFVARLAFELVDIVVILETCLDGMLRAFFLRRINTIASLIRHLIPYPHLLREFTGLLPRGYHLNIDQNMRHELHDIERGLRCFI